MREHLSQWDFVTAAYAVVTIGMMALIGWTLFAMRRAELRRDEVKRR